MINEVISSHSLRKTAEPTPFTEIDSKHRNPLGSFLLCFAGEGYIAGRRGGPSHKNTDASSLTNS